MAYFRTLFPSIFLALLISLTAASIASAQDGNNTDFTVNVPDTYTGGQVSNGFSSQDKLGNPKGFDITRAELRVTGDRAKIFIFGNVGSYIPSASLDERGGSLFLSTQAYSPNSDLSQDSAATGMRWQYVSQGNARYLPSVGTPITGNGPGFGPAFEDFEYWFHVEDGTNRAYRRRVCIPHRSRNKLQHT